MRNGYRYGWLYPKSGASVLVCASGPAQRGRIGEAAHVGPAGRCGVRPFDQIEELSLRTRTVPSRPVGVPSCVLAVLVAVVAGLAAAFVVVPPRMVGDPAGDLGDQDHLAAAFRMDIVQYWRSGDRNYPPALRRVVDYWFRFHVVKGGIAMLLLVVLVALTVVLWRARLRSNGLGTGGRAVIVSAGTAAPLLALSALAVVMANVQGAMAPFASLLPMLMDGTPDDGLTDTLAQARQQLADSHRTSGYTPAALDAMVSDFAWYHAVLAVIAVVVAVGLAGLSWVLWRSVARTESADRPTRRVLGSFGALSALSSLIVLVVFVANTGTAMNPASVAGLVQRRILSHVHRASAPHPPSPARPQIGITSRSRGVTAQGEPAERTDMPRVARVWHVAVGRRARGGGRQDGR
jgi:hypothetical protein